MANPEDFSHYNVYRSSLFAGPYVLIASTIDTTFEDTTAIVGEIYFYQITSVDLYGNESDPSAPISLTFSSSSGSITLASLTPDNVVVVYREFDNESQEFAERYRDFHNLQNDQVIAVPCSSIEILADYSDFQSQIENPILDALTASGAPLLDRSVYAIVVMPRVPGGFYDGIGIISTTSRLSRIYFPYNSSERKVLNPLYDPIVFKRFSENDLDKAIICTRFDSPTAAITNQWFDNSETAVQQLSVSGKLYYDPYAAIFRSGAEEYESEQVSFLNGFARNLGLDIEETTRVDPYIDPILPRVTDDSFVWSWGADESSLTFFRTSTSLRCLFYNADFDGASTIRDIDSRSWPLLAIRSGYVATAGSMSDDGIDTFLRPFPMFNALFRGATLGEAFLYSQPKLNTSMAVFGDPLLQVVFPIASSSSDLVQEDEAWELMGDCLAQAIAANFRKSTILKELRDDIISGDDIDVTLDLANVANVLGSVYEDPDWKNDYFNLVHSYINMAVQRNATAFPAHYPLLNDYLDETEKLMSEIVLDAAQNDVLKNSINTIYLRVEGSWEFVFELEHPNEDDFAFYQFEFDVSTTADFDEEDIVLSKESESSVTNWERQNENNVYEPMSVNGVTSNFVGKNVRYINKEGEELERGVFYYFRVRQKDQLATYPYRVFRQIIYR